MKRFNFCHNLNSSSITFFSNAQTFFNPCQYYSRVHQLTIPIRTHNSIFWFLWDNHFRWHTTRFQLLNCDSTKCILVYWLYYKNQKSFDHRNVDSQPVCLYFFFYILIAFSMWILPTLVEFSTSVFNNYANDTLYPLTFYSTYVHFVYLLMFFIVLRSS